jgi:hypothetical protein
MPITHFLIFLVSFYYFYLGQYRTALRGPAVLVGSRSADRAKPLTIATTILRNCTIKNKSADRANPLTIDRAIFRNCTIKYKSADRAKPLTIDRTILRNCKIKIHLLGF